VLTRFAEGTLPRRARAGVAAHLESCETCRAALKFQPEPTVQHPRGQADPLIGQLLGEYRVLERIGRGGMGVVYRGEQPQIGKQVAIKVVLHEAAHDPEAMQRMMDEARAVNAVRHPNIVDIFSLGQLPDGRPYVVMELLEGQSLQDLLKERGFLTVTQVLDVLGQALAALEAAHRVGVIHRDLKPANIAVDSREAGLRVTLLDFGLALRQSAPPTRATDEGLVVGTPAYMSPEQVRGEAVTSATDVYAMGVVAWTLLTGREPFSGQTLIEVMAHHLETPAPPLPDALEVPPALADLIARMLEKNPAARPTASEARAEVKALTQGASTAAAVVESHRQKRGTLLIAAGAVLAVVIGAGFLIAVTSTPDPLPTAAVETRPIARPPEVPRVPIPESADAGPTPPLDVALPPPLYVTNDPNVRWWKCEDFTRTSDIYESTTGQFLAFQISFTEDKSLMVAARFDRKTRKRTHAQLSRFRQQVEACRFSGLLIVAGQSVGERIWFNKLHETGKPIDAVWYGVVRVQPEFVSLQQPTARDAGR
jgi:serine/threonine protein kinase